MVGGSELELNGLRLDVSQEYSAREGKSEGLSKDVISKQFPYCPLSQLSRQPEFLISPQHKTTDSYQEQINKHPAALSLLFLTSKLIPNLIYSSYCAGII